MRILFDAFWWTDGPVSNRQVQREIIRHWIEEFPGDDLTLAVRHRHANAADLPAGVPVLTTRVWPHGLAAIAHYPRLARRVRADLTVTHNFTPLTGRAAVFVHDVMFQTDPSWFTRPERAYYALIPPLLRRAEVVATSSRHEAQRIARCNPRLRGPVHPIGLAVGTSLRDAVPVAPAGMEGAGRFVLSVGRLNVRKNLARTFAGAIASGTVSPERPLVVVGEPEGVRTSLEPPVQRAIEQGAIRLLGGIDDGQLAWLYGHADLFVFLTLDEGFGLPPVEALSFGCPVLASDIPVLRETLGERATFVDPSDPAAIAAAFMALDPPPARVASAAPDWRTTVRRLRSAIDGNGAQLG